MVGVITSNSASRLTTDETRALNMLYTRMASTKKQHEQWDRYYNGTQEISSIGIAVPQELRPFIFPLNWPRIVVDSIVQRQSVKSFSVPNDSGKSEILREIWESNNMESQQVLNHTETRVQGHGFVAVGVNPDDAEHPLITVESSKCMCARVDPRNGMVLAALRVYNDPWGLVQQPVAATLYLPDSTIWLDQESGRWEITSRDDHNLHRVPVVQFLNRPRVGQFYGESEMVDVVQPTDMAARAVLDLQIAMETHAVPGKWGVGVTNNSFIDAKTGKPASALQTYFNSMLTSKNPDAKFGQFTASDLKNFKTVIDLLSEQVSAISGLPMRYFGQNTVNPAAEGAIKADESRLIKNVELKNLVDGDCWSQVMALAYLIREGEPVNANLVRCDWEDPATPTFAQKSDAISKLVAQGVISREGAWDELGFSEARKDKEREYFARELREAYEPMLKGVDYGGDDGGAAGAADDRGTAEELAES